MRKCNACEKKFKDLDGVATHILEIDDTPHRKLRGWATNRLKKERGEITAFSEVPTFLIEHTDGRVKKDTLVWARALAKRGRLDATRLRLEAKRLLDLAKLQMNPAEFSNRAEAIEAREVELDKAIARFRAGEEKLAGEREEVKRKKKDIREQSALIAEDAPKLKKYHNELKKAGVGKSIKFPTLSITSEFYKNGEEEEE